MVINMAVFGEVQPHVVSPKEMKIDRVTSSFQLGFVICFEFSLDNRIVSVLCDWPV